MRLGKTPMWQVLHRFYQGLSINKLVFSDRERQAINKDTECPEIFLSNLNEQYLLTGDAEWQGRKSNSMVCFHPRVVLYDSCCQVANIWKEPEDPQLNVSHLELVPVELKALISPSAAIRRLLAGSRACLNAHRAQQENTRWNERLILIICLRNSVYPSSVFVARAGVLSERWPVGDFLWELVNILQV